MILLKFYIISQVIFTARMIGESSKMCVCGHIRNEEACLKSLICNWSNGSCLIRSGLNYINSEQVQTDCKFYGQEDCRIQQHCGFHLGYCIDFEGCRMFKKEFCQDSSFQCVSDGDMCIQIKECKDYLSQVGCQNKNQKGGYCIWNLSEQVKCQDVNSCEDLPVYLQNNEQCAQGFEGCTVSDQGYGCISKKQDCNEFKFENQCYTTLNQKTCFWSTDQGLCLEKICENFNFSTDFQCKQQLDQCTTNGINCVIRKLCQDAESAAGCISDRLGNKCEYYDGHCTIKTCFTASNLINTYQQCQYYDQILDCVLSENGGCKPRPDHCSGYFGEIDCYSIKSQDCIWFNNKCEQKECHHAPNGYTHLDCISFGNCIGKIGGGCEITPEVCEGISNKLFCNVNYQGQKCFWMNNKCILLECNNLRLPQFKDHKTCQSASPSCTFNFQLQGCTDFTCENISEIGNCSTDSKGNTCLINKSCILKQCKTAPYTYNTNQECENWIPECTVQVFSFSTSKVFLGCIKKNKDCQFYQQEQCYKTIEGFNCKWNSTIQACQNEECSNADINKYTTNSDCSKFKISGQICVIGNSGQGCQTWPNSCSNLQTEGLCNLNLQNGTQCFWSETFCKEKECSDALKTQFTNNIECNTWMDICIYNPTIGGCQIRTSNMECTQSPNTNMYDTHQKCNAWNPKCTVVDNFKEEGCIIKSSDCSQYTRSFSCKTTLTGIKCYWDDLNQKCQIWDFNNDSIPDCQKRIYGDLSHQDCSSFLPHCTLAVIDRQCILNNINCQMSKEQQCIINIFQQPCQWDYTIKLCKDVLCGDNTTATSESECLKWRRNYECQLKINQNGSYGLGCQNRPVDCQQVTNPIICNRTFTRNNQSCFYIQNEQKCQILADSQCELVTFAKTNQQCQYYNKNCILQQEGLNCISFNQCQYLSINTCGSATMSFNNKCFYSSYCRPNNSCQDIQAYYSQCHYQTDGFGNRCYYYTEYAYSSIYGQYYNYYCFQYTNVMSLSFSSNDVQQRAIECQQFSSSYHYENGQCYGNSYCNQLSTFGRDFCNSANLLNNQLCGFNVQSNICEDRLCEHLNLINYPNITSKGCFEWKYSCVLANSGCVQFSGNDCTQIKLIYQCLQYSQCKWQTGHCVAFTNCEDNQTALTNYECLLISSQFCRLNFNLGQGCAFLSCQVITHQMICNSAHTSDGQSCKWTNKCESKNCGEYTDQASCQDKYQLEKIYEVSVLLKCFWCNNSCSSNNACDSNIQTPPVKHSDCYKSNPFKTIDINFTSKCTTKESSCSNYVYQAACQITINDIKCYWEQTDSKCYDYCKSKKTGSYDHASCFNYADQCMSLSNMECQLLDCSTLPNQNDCEYFPQKCFWSGSSCIKVGACSNFTSSALCTKNSDQQICIWDGTNCIEKQCSNYIGLPSSTNCKNWLNHCKYDTNTSTCVEDCASADYSFISHEQCETFYPNKICTLKPGQIQCVNLPPDCSFAKQTQCFQDIQGNLCYYSQTLNQCFSLQCSVLEFNNHLECNQKLKSCTVKPTLNGCQVLDECSNYVIKEQCQIDILLQKCEWINNQNKCTLKTCSTAQLSSYSVNSCQQYFGQNCTVNKFFNNCIIASKRCSDYSQEQCQSQGQMNYDGILCFWDGAKKLCLEKICSNGPTNASSHAECIDYLNSCQRGGCGIKNCYNFYYPFEQACSEIFKDKRCTTNGFQCVDRQNCEDVQILDGCNYDKNLLPCVWVDNKCMTKTCETADETFNKHEDCQQYLFQCTVKQGGGCVQKKACKDYVIKESCHSDMDNQECIWDDLVNQCFINQCIGFCGDGIIQSYEEQCDDANYLPYDGCYKCQIQCPYGCFICNGNYCEQCNEFGWQLKNGICYTQCGDGYLAGTESCDDGNEIEHDGCYQCQYQCDQLCLNCFQGICIQCSKGYQGVDAFCKSVCGDGQIVTKFEQCDDGNLLNGDGCNKQCKIEKNWKCQTVNDISNCYYSISPSLKLSSKARINPGMQEIEISFSEEVRLNSTDINEEQFLQMIVVVIQNSNKEDYYVELKGVKQITSQLSIVIYLVQIYFLNQISNPSLKVAINCNNIVNFQDMPLLSNEIVLPIKSPNLISKNTISLVTSTALFNQWMLNSIIIISIISFLCGNLEILWNLLDLLQQLSYIKYHNIKFPENLIIYFEVFSLGSFTPIIKFLNFDSYLQNSFQFHVPEFYAKYKFENYQLKCNFFEIVETCVILLITGIINFLLFKMMSKFLNQLKFENWPIIYSQFMLLMKYVIGILYKIQKMLNSYYKNFFYSGIIRIYIANYYEITFAAALQIDNFNTKTKVNTIISITALGTLAINFLLLFLIFSYLNQQNVNQHVAIFIQGIKYKLGGGTKQYYTVVQMKKTFFILNIVFFQDFPEAQSLVTALLSGIYAVYMITFQPFKNKFENNKIIVTEILIMLNTMLFSVQQIFSMKNNLEVLEYLGWVNVGGFSMILVSTLLIDVYQQIYKYFNSIKFWIEKIIFYCEQLPK